MFVDVSARNGTNIDELLEAVTLTADVSGTDALTRTRKHAALLLKQTWTRVAARFPPSWFSPVPCASVTLSLPVLLTVACVQCSTRYGQAVKEAGPSRPVQVLGLSTVPRAGDTFLSTEEERTATSDR